MTKQELWFNQVIRFVEGHVLKSRFDTNEYFFDFPPEGKDEMKILLMRINEHLAKLGFNSSLSKMDTCVKLNTQRRKDGGQDANEINTQEENHPNKKRKKTHL